MTPGEDTPRWHSTLLGRFGLWTAFVWGFAEATLFFIVPDMLFTLTTLLRPRRGLLQLAAAVLGATLGGCLMYAWSARAPVQARSAVSAVPYVGEEMILAAQRRWEEHGVRALFDSPLSGVPFKVYAVLAPARMPATEFCLLSILMRAERMLLTWVPFALVALLFDPAGGRRGRIAVALHGTFWIALYAIYWSLK